MEGCAREQHQACHLDGKLRIKLDLRPVSAALIFVRYNNTSHLKSAEVVAPPRALGFVISKDCATPHNNGFRRLHRKTARWRRRVLKSSILDSANPLAGDGSAKGKYVPASVTECQHGSQCCSSKNRSLVRLRLMIALLVVGASLILFHHVFYSHLNHKSISAAAAELPTFLRNQSNVNFIGTLIAHGTRIVLSIAIAATFAQLFWETFRTRSLTIRQIDALVKCSYSPFHLSAFRAASASLSLFFVSFVASAMAFIVIVTPGSLIVSPDFQRRRPCTVPSVPQDILEFHNVPDRPLLFDISMKALTSSSYISPFRAITCGEGASGCSYNLSFVGSALDCVDRTNETDFSPFKA